MLISLTLKLGLAAPLPFMLHHAPPAPVAPVVAVVAPAPAQVPPVTTTAATTPPVTEPTAVPGPQPQGTSSTTTQTDCVVQWPVTATAPDGTTFQTTGTYEGDCGTAAQVAAANPGSTTTTNTFYLTTTPGEAS